MKQKLSRTTRRREQIHQNILETAGRLFIEHGIKAVSLEEIAATADMARRTVYNHFKSKEDLLSAIVVPIIASGQNFVDSKLNQATINVEEICNFCLDLWKKFGDHLLIMYNKEIGDYKTISEPHREFIKAFIMLVERLEPTQDPRLIFRFNSSDVTARMLYRTFLHILISIHAEPDWEAQFKSLTRDMIFVKAPVGMQDDCRS